jgi:hypothetical protein
MAMRDTQFRQVERAVRLHSPIASKLQRILLRRGTLADVAEQAWNLAPADAKEAPAAIYLPDELERVTGFPALTSREYEMARIRPRTLVQPASRAYRLKNVVFSGGDLYKGPYKYLIRGSRRRLLARIPTAIDDGGVLASTWLGGQFFGHWLAEDVPLKIMASDLGEATEIDFPQTAHQKAYSALFGIKRRTLPDFGSIGQLIVIDTELYSNFRNTGWSRMAAAIDAKFKTPPHLGCMLLRGPSGNMKRLLVNEQEVAERLQALGFKIIDPQAASLDEVLALASNSKIAAGVEGSQLGHGFHCLHPHGAMLVFMPPYHFGCAYKDRCDRRDNLYAFSVGHQTAEGFRVDLDSVERVFDLVVRELRRRHGADFI